MSLLQLKQDPIHEHDASSEGEDYAKGSSYLLWTTLAAILLVTLGAMVFVLVAHQPPVAVGEITQVWAHEVHTINTPIDANGVQTASEAFDQVLVLANVKLRNQSDKPIVLRQMMTNATFDDGPHSSYIATATDYQRIFIAYPELKHLESSTLSLDTVIQPGQSLEGMVVSLFHVTQPQWAAHKDLSFTFQLKFHPELVLVPKTPVTEI